MGRDDTLPNWLYYDKSQNNHTPKPENRLTKKTFALYDYSIARRTIPCSLMYDYRCFALDFYIIYTLSSLRFENKLHSIHFCRRRQ